MPASVSRTTYCASMSLLVILIILLFVLGGGGFYAGGPYVGGGAGGIDSTHPDHPRAHRTTLAVIAEAGMNASPVSGSANVKVPINNA
jgi:hypothetical protein